MRLLVGSIWRNIDRKLNRQNEVQSAKAASILARVKRLLEQKPKDKNKLYRLHVPEVEYISKGKVRQSYEFGLKVTVSTMRKEGLVVGMHSLPGNPYDGHCLPEAIEQGAIVTDQKPKAKGYRGIHVDGVTIWCSGQKRGVTPSIRKTIHRRSAI